MRKLLFRLVSQFTCLIGILGTSGCVVPGMGPHDKNLGYNGSFEIVESELPVSWTLSRYPIKDGAVEAFVDTTDAVAGNRSLRIVVHEYVSTHRWTPFLFQVRDVEVGKTYAVSFWLKNQGCKVLVEIGYEQKYHMFGVKSEEETRDYDAHPRITAILGDAAMGDDEWRQFLYQYTVPETDGTMRFEVKFLQKGTLWIDDVQIELVSDGEPAEGVTDTKVR